MLRGSAPCLSHGRPCWPCYSDFGGVHRSWPAGNRRGISMLSVVSGIVSSTQHHGLPLQDCVALPIGPLRCRKNQVSLLCMCGDACPGEHAPLFLCRSDCWPGWRSVRATPDVWMQNLAIVSSSSLIRICCAADAGLLMPAVILEGATRLEPLEAERHASFAR